MNKGVVYLIGAGPGDAGLLTLRGRDCLEQADVVIYDHLVNPEILEHCSRQAERIYVGKMADKHTKTQDEINNLLVVHADAGKKVARLKGGDPCIFGRGGEEALVLYEQQIPFEIVPGVTAASGAGAYAGIPLTHRDYASSLALVTGHAAAGKENDPIRWDKLAGAADTLVFYMGVNNLPVIAARLQEQGRPGNTPAALVARATLEQQQTVTGTLENITELAAVNNVQPPALIIVGEVVQLREKLRWFDNRPLTGRKIHVTRSRSQASRLTRELRSLGAQVVEFPTIDIQPCTDFAELDRACTALDTYTGLIFTSVNAVDIFCSRLLALGYDSRVLHGKQVIVIGRETGHALARFGIKPDLVPEHFTSEGVVAALQDGQTEFKGKRILMPCSELARDHIPAELEKWGAVVDVLPVYGNRLPAYREEEVAALFTGSGEVYFTFTSSSTVENLVSLLKTHNRTEWLSRIRGFSIGPVTTQTADRAGIRIVAGADPHTIGDLVQTILRYFKDKK